jgi:glycosyltransferase involved in cell wall biosynthesis
MPQFKLFEASRMALKILTVLAGAPVGGAETFFVSLTTALARAGVEVRSVLKPNKERELALSSCGIGYELAPFRSMFDFSTSAVLRRAAATFHADAVLAFAGRAASFLPQGPQVRIGRLGGYYNLRNFRRCGHLVCNAPDLIRYVTEGGWPAERVSLVPNFPALPEGTKLDRRALDTPDEAPLALVLGRLHRNKGLDVLIRATASIPELFVWIAGEGEERPVLQRLTEELGLAKRIKFLGWRNDRASLLKTADLCVYPSREEPFGNVVVEAWAAGTPLVTTASTGPRWLVKDGEDALMTPVDDVAALAGAIRALIAAPERRAALAAAGRRRVKEEFSEPVIIARYLELFERLTGKAAR